MECPQAGSLSPALVQYYNATTAALLGDQGEAARFALEDVSTNPKISGLLPFYVSFIRTGIQKHSGQGGLLKRLLLFLKALFANPHLNFSPKPYVSC